MFLGNWISLLPQLPAINEIYRRFNPFCCCCCCFPSIPMHVLVRIPMSGYTPGQAIDVDIEVNNRSDQNSEFKVQLKKVFFPFIKWQFIRFNAKHFPLLLQQITYHANNSSSTYVESIMICEQNRIGLSPINTMKAFRTSLIVPPIPPTDELASNVCKVRYIVRVSGSPAKTLPTRISELSFWMISRSLAQSAAATLSQLLICPSRSAHSPIWIISTSLKPTREGRAMRSPAIHLQHQFANSRTQLTCRMGRFPILVGSQQNSSIFL